MTRGPRALATRPRGWLRRGLVLAALALAGTGGLEARAQAQAPGPAAASAPAPGDARAANVELIRERMAHHVGTLAFLWGWPIVDMTRKMHNETHRAAGDGRPVAPVNHFRRQEALATPSTPDELRAPNNDTLNLRGWFDLSREPVIVQVPDTAGRYYTLAVTDFFNEVTHLGRRTTGTGARAFALVGPGWTGVLPPEVTAVSVATPQVWILGRLLVTGEADLPAARELLRQFWSAPLSQWRRDAPPVVPPAPEGARLDPMGSLAFFEVLNGWLRTNAINAGGSTPAVAADPAARAAAADPAARAAAAGHAALAVRPDQGALLGLFDQVGFGPRNRFSVDALDAATRRGLERALADGQALLRASANRPLQDVRNGWIFPLALADYGHDLLTRAGVAFAGYANRPEETVYVSRTVDDVGRPLSGTRRYRLHFAPGALPPVGAFWSLTAYDLRRFALIENPARRYSLGDRTPGLRFNADGSLDLHIGKEPPAEGTANWLPVGDAPYLLVMRLYEPQAAVFDGRWRPPGLTEQ